MDPSQGAESCRPGDRRCARHAGHQPWQALSALQTKEGRASLVCFDVDWESVILDHAEHGDPWARAVASGVDENFQVTADLISTGHLLSSVCRWPPADLERYRDVLGWFIYGPAGALPSRHRSSLVRAVADLVRRDRTFQLPHALFLRSHDAIWRAALDEAGATEHLERWFALERTALAEAAAAQAGDRSSPEPFALRPVRREIEQCITRLLGVGEVLHRHGITTPLRSLVAEATPEQGARSLAWTVGILACRVLVRLRDVEALRAGLSRRDAHSTPTEVVLNGAQDVEAELWIADVLGANYAAVLKRAPTTSEVRDAAKRWALEPAHPDRRWAAARWLLEHPANGELEHVGWLFSRDQLSLTGFSANAGLYHPDERVRRAAAALLQRALRELGEDAELVAIARSFMGGLRGDDEGAALSTLVRYLESVNRSGERFAAGTLETVIQLAQRYAGTVTETLLVAHTCAVCRALAVAARRARLASLEAWVRSPLGSDANTVADSHALEDVRYAIADGALDGAATDDLERGVLQAIADTAPEQIAVRAHGLLLELDPPSDADLVAEWGLASDAALVWSEPATARWSAVHERFRRREPREFSRRLADRLLALLPALRRRAISLIPEIAAHDPEQGARLSALFD